jgi:hypothetical protein
MSQPTAAQRNTLDAHVARRTFTALQRHPTWRLAWNNGEWTIRDTTDQTIASAIAPDLAAAIAEYLTREIHA